MYEREDKGKSNETALFSLYFCRVILLTGKYENYRLIYCSGFGYGLTGVCCRRVLCEGEVINYTYLCCHSNELMFFFLSLSLSFHALFFSFSLFLLSSVCGYKPECSGQHWARWNPAEFSVLFKHVFLPFYYCALLIC